MIAQEYWQYFPARPLPEIELAGVKFFIDLRLWECRDVDDFMNKFSLDDLYEDDKNGFVCCFDLKAKNLFHGTKDEAEARKDELRVVRLPGIKQMDPVGYRAMMGLAPKQKVLLERPPVKKYRGKKL